MKDVSGQVIVEPYYDKIRKFVNGFAAVCKDDKWGYINEQGELIVDIIYYHVKNFSSFGVAIIQKEYAALSWCLLKSDGTEISPPKGNRLGPIGDFNECGIAIVRLYSWYRLLDINGEFVSEDRYQNLTYIEKEGIFKGQKLGNLCIINSLGEIVTHPEKNYDSLYFPTGGLSIVSLDEKYGYIDEAGKEVIPLQFEEGYEFSESGLAFVVFADGLGGYINTKGETVIEPTYETGTVFTNGLAAVSKDETYFYIDEEGNQPFAETYQYASNFATCGLANVVTHEGKHVVIKLDGTVTFDLDGDCEIQDFGYNREITTVKYSNQVALMNSKGELLTDFVFDEIKLSDYTDTHPFLQDGLWGYIDDTGEIVIDNEYEDVSLFTDYNIAKVALRDPYQPEAIYEFYINNNNEIIDEENLNLLETVFHHNFDSVERFYDNMTIAVKKEEEVVLNAKGEVIVDY